MALFRLSAKISLLLLILLSACSSVDITSSLPTLPITSPTQADPLPTPSQSNTDVPTQESEIFFGPLSVVIRHPSDNATVYQTPVIVSGDADPGTIISLNDQVVLVDETGSFQSPISLEPGINMIEITASDFENHQDFSYMTVFLETQP